MKPKKLESGANVKVPFGDYHTYARTLNYGDSAFYDIRTKEDIADLVGQRCMAR